MNGLTPWTKRTGIIFLSIVIIVLVVYDETTLAGTVIGGLLLFINPKD